MKLLDRFIKRTAYWRYVEKVTTSGYMPQPSHLLQRLFRVLFSIWAFVQAGRIEVKGLENYDPSQRMVLCPNHSSFLDAVVLYPYVHENTRCMGAYDVMRNFWGIPGIVLTKLGAFAVDRSRGKTVLGPATDALVAGYSIGMFPEGRISPTGEMVEFKLGAAYIANAAYERLDHKERIGIVPCFLEYHKRHAASALNYLKMGLRWRGGVTVHVLPPIWLDELDNRDPVHIMSLVRKAIVDAGCAEMKGDS